jgi:sarcosine oxidase, subunit beta
VANAYGRAAERLGARLMLGNDVARLDAPDGVVKSVVLSDGTRVGCSKVVLCTNVWTNSLLARSGVEKPRESLPLWTVPHPVVAFSRPDRFQGNRPVIWDGPGKTYYKPEGRSLIFVGTLDSALDQRELEPEEAPSGVPFETIESFTEMVARRIPVMAEGSLHSSYIGMYDVTPDQHPIVDELSQLGLGGAFCCVGLNGHGFKLSPALGLMTAEMVLGRSEAFGPSFDRSYFALSRFKTGREMKAGYSGLATVA